MKQYRYLCLALVLAATAAAQERKNVVEEIVARVNNEIITLSDLSRARATLTQEVDEDCKKGCTPKERDDMFKEKENNLLADLINQSLLVQRGKDLGFSVEADVIKRMDQIRQQNNIASMEELEKAVNQQGSFEEWKASLRNGMLTQEVIRREIRINFEDAEIKKYYDEHQKDFVRPERVYLAEMFVNTEGKKEDEIPDLEKKANTLLGRVRNGEDFHELAKRYSDGSTAKEGGDLGGDGFGRDELAKEISEAVFKLNRNEMTDVIRTKTGFLILRVLQRFEAGLQPIEKVGGEIQNRLYYEKLRPAMKEYLTKLREESYVLVKPGYADSQAVASTPIAEVQPAPEGEQEKKKRKKFLGII